MNDRERRAAYRAAMRHVELGDLAEPVSRFRFENWIDREAEAVRRILVAGLESEGFLHHD